MASKFIKGLFEKLTILPGDWLIMQPDAEEDTAYKIKKSNVKSDRTEPSTWYVHSAPEGDDGNVGSDKFPFENISAAIDAYAAGDIIKIIDEGYSSNENITINKKTTIVGPVANITGGAAFTQLQGAWTIDAGGLSVIFENLTTRINWSSSLVFNLDVINGAIGSSSSFPARLTDLILHDSFYSLGASSELRSLECHSCIGIGSDAQIGRTIQLHATDHVGNITGGLDSSSTVTLKNSSINGNLANTGDLNKTNSVITGTETVSGTTTNEVQDDATKLSKTTASDQTVASNIEFTKNVLADKLAADVATQLNALDIGGGAAIGAGYAGIFTAPINGLLVEGDLFLGRTSSLHKFDAAGTARVGFTADGAQNLVFGAIPVVGDGDRGRFWYDGVNTTVRFDTATAGQNIVIGSYNSGANDAYVTIIGASGRLGLMQPLPDAQADINQPDDAINIPVIKLTQAFATGGVFKFDATIGTGNSIEAVAAKTLTPTHFLKCNIEGVGDIYIQAGTIA